ncbi:MAG: 2-keto-4-pentenoate hydratase [Alphaproteobacteria bacterium]
MTEAEASRHARAAELLAAARLACTPIEPLPADCRPRDEAEGYAVQEALHGRLAAAGRGAVVGYKIGCTTPVMQALLDIDFPCAGGVFSTTVHHGAAVLRHADFVSPGVETEIAVRLGADLAADAAPFTPDTAAEAVDACMVAIELVDLRYADYRAMGVPTLIADDFFGAGCVLGEPVSDWRDLDLAAATGVTTIDGIEAGRGKGADVMGDPLAALAWLANAMGVRGRGLRRGAFVLTGSIVAVQKPTPGQQAVVTVDGLGSVRARFD